MKQTLGLNLKDMMEESKFKRACLMQEALIYEDNNLAITSKTKQISSNSTNIDLSILNKTVKPIFDFHISYIIIDNIILHMKPVHIETNIAPLQSLY